jgi:hypothetical protein
MRHGLLVYFVAVMLLGWQPWNTLLKGAAPLSIWIASKLIAVQAGSRFQRNS